jgi:hypothetical protein
MARLGNEAADWSFDEAVFRGSDNKNLPESRLNIQRFWKKSVSLCGLPQ